MTTDRELRMDSHTMNINAALVTLLTDSQLDSEDVLDVLVPIKEFVAEQIANAQREASPG